MKIIILRGLAASGKTTLALKLAEKISAQIWNKDVLFDICLNCGIDWGTSNTMIYEYLYSYLLVNKNNKTSLIIDAPFYRNKDIKKMILFCLKNNIILRTILVSCGSEDVWRERFSQRKKSPNPNQAITDFDEIKNYYGTMQVKPLPGEFMYDSSTETGVQLKKIIDYVS